MLERTSAMTVLKFLSLTLIGIALSLPVGSAFALAENEYDLTPVVIDRKAKVRAILKETIRITNTSERKLNLFPTVNDIDPSEGKEEFVSAQDSRDRSASLANWIELSRGEIELAPGEEKEIPFVIRVNMNAVPGTYHSVIMFSEGSTREAAEKAGSDAKVAVNLEIEADIKEIMQLNKFTTDSVFISGDDVVFNFQLENIGNQELTPKGEIRIYDRKGQEVAAIPVNENGKAFNPDEVVQLASAWNATSGFGKYKAFLNIDYGNEQQASVYDTIYFWIFPWQQLLGMFIASFVIIIGLAFYFHRWLERRHLAKVAVLASVHGGTVGIMLPNVSNVFDEKKNQDAEASKQNFSDETVDGPVEEPKRIAMRILKWKMMFSSLFRGKRVIEKREKKVDALHTLEAQSAPSVEPSPTLAALGDGPAIRSVKTRGTNSQIPHTINLKQFSEKEKKEHHPHHIVNLKK